MGNHFNSSVMQVVYDGYLRNGYDDKGSYVRKNSMNYETYSLNNNVTFITYGKLINYITVNLTN